ncbi:hypothetical protein [Paenibacillus alvei]|jgi:hypothetical protein|uniref:hypothetical protein n=1 Tax=Paenibacillus alvei TaxID=44250 RepID=UPI0003FE15AF|nr:hypothetical protein [Paenibacillus alvei]
MRPKQSYIIGFSQQVGGTLLNYALASTGMGKRTMGNLRNRHDEKFLFQMWFYDSA